MNRRSTDLGPAGLPADAGVEVTGAHGVSAPIPESGTASCASAVFGVLDAAAFARLGAGPEIPILLSRIPAWLGPRSGAIAGFAACQAERLIANRVHPTFARRVGLRPEIAAVQDCRNVEELAAKAAHAPPPVLAREAPPQPRDKAGGPGVRLAVAEPVGISCRDRLGYSAFEPLPDSCHFRPARHLRCLQRPAPAPPCVPKEPSMFEQRCWPYDASIPVATGLLRLWCAASLGFVGFLFSVLPGCLLLS